ncbi:uncharacterized protein V2V93DRAFT_366620 [Kockiozyma suomiensis]|uniref:uncharacterized protein n=1 Tax=Kockiozyma suomiensis TaxID=1337062 RepID=UPI003342F67A
MRMRNIIVLGEVIMLLVVSIYLSALYLPHYINQLPDFYKMSTKDFHTHTQHKLSMRTDSIEVERHRQSFTVQEERNYLANFSSLDSCFVSSNAIYGAAGKSPCYDSKSFIESVSSGGRIGVDAPYHCQGCALWWHSTEDICTILSRYEHILFVGDESIENVFGGLLSLLREDLMYGSLMPWAFINDWQANECTCDKAFSSSACPVTRPTSVRQILDHNSNMIKCRGAPIANVEIIRLPSLDLNANEESIREVQTRLVRLIARDSNPVAFIYSHGFDLEIATTWLAHARDALVPCIPRAVTLHEIFLTPGASGPQVSNSKLATHGLQATQRFENGMRERARTVGFDVLGTWNATVQTRFLDDGLHNGVAVNLLKAMMVVNWLELVEQ